MQLQPIFVTMNNLMGGRLFRIPEYQRAYAWGKKQREDLFGDIKRVYASNEDHFMATVVGLTRERVTIVADQYSIVEIVDGQQRLTTLIILLKAVQKALDRNDPTEAKLFVELNDLLIKGDDHSLLFLQTNHDTSQISSEYIRDGKISGIAKTLADQNIIDAIISSESFVSEWKTLHDSHNGGTEIFLPTVLFTAATAMLAQLRIWQLNSARRTSASG